MNLKNIAGAFTTKIGGAVLNLLVVLLVCRYLGAAGKGAISLLIANISILLLFSGILGGTALIYLTPRHNVYQLLLPAYLASVGWCSAIAYSWQALHLIPDTFNLWALSLLYALFSINTMVLLGKKQVQRYNLLTFLQPLVMVVVLLVNFSGLGHLHLNAFIQALYISYSLFCGLSFYYIRQLPDAFEWRNFKLAFKDLLDFGTTAQLTNFFSFINNRIGFYLLNYFIALQVVGIYSVGVALAEGLWLIGRNIALVQYTRIANTSDKVKAGQETLQLAKLSFGLTILGLTVLLGLPVSFYTWMFGEEFGQVRKVIFFLSAGIAAVSLGNIFIHYFSGMGRNKFNTAAAIIGLAITVPMAWLLVPKLGLAGAGLATSSGHVAATIYLLYAFRKDSNLSLLNLLPGRRDFALMKTKLF